MTDTNQNILLLRKFVEESLECEITTATDFIYLSGVIKGRLKKTLSVSTLKRIWGYIDGYQNVRESTLDTLSAFVGYTDYRTFVKDYCESEKVYSSQRLLSKPLYAKEIPLDKEIEIQWNPNRRCHLRHLGEGKFVVVLSEKSKLSVGDTFFCRSFYMNQPCFLENFVHGNDLPCDFVVGNRHGLTKIKPLYD